MRKQKYAWRKRRHLSGDMNLQITSMADIFIILLVFLLKGYSAGAMSITPSPGTRLPAAFAEDAQVEALKVEVSENGILVEGNPIATLKQYQFDAADLRSGGISQSLVDSLKRERERQLAIAKVNTDVQVDSKIIIIADQNVPYGTLKTVLSSAAVNGYTDFKLAVAKGD